MQDEVKTQIPTDTKPRWWVRPLCIGLIILGSVVIGAGALSWRLAQGPWQANFIVPIIERSLSEDGGLQFDIGEMSMVWRGGTTPLGFDLKDIRVSGARGDFMAISHADVALSPLYLLAGQLHFAHANISNLDLRIIRLPDGTITLTGSDQEDNKPKSKTVGLTLDVIARKLPAIDNMVLKDTLVIFEDQKDVIIRRFEDVQVEMTQSGRFSKRSFAGFITAPLTGMENDSNAAMDFVYNADDKLLTVAASIDRANTRRLIGPWLRQAGLPRVDMLVEGRAQVQLDNNFRLHALNFHLKGEDGMLIWPRSYGQGLENQKLTNFDIEIAFDPETQTLELRNAELTSKGLTIATSGALTVTDEWQKMNGFIDLDIPVVAVDLLPAIWPKIWDVGAREWLVEKMDRGRFSKIAVHVPLSAILTDVEPETQDTAEEEGDSSKRWVFETGTIGGTFGFTGVTVDYRTPMIPASNVTGTGLFEGVALTLNVTRANAGGLNMTRGRVFFDDLITPGKGNAELNFEMTGSVKSVFDYLDREPISYRKKVDLDLTGATGQAGLIVDVKFPATKDMRMEDVHVDARAKLQNLNVPGAVKGMTLAGGPFDLEASENHFRISGAGTLEGQPANVMWHELFSAGPKDAFASKLEADLQTNKAMRKQFIGTLEDRVDEAIIPATVTMTTLPSGRADLKVTATLNSARIDFSNPFNTVKEAGKTAKASLSGTLMKGEIQSIDTLSITGDGISLASGSIAFARDKDNVPILSKAILKGLALGETSADITAEWPTEYEIKADISGTSFDARWIMADEPATAGGEVAPAPGLAYDVALKLDRLLIGSIPLEKVSGAFVGNTKGVQRMANLDAMAGGAPVSLRYGATGQAGDGLFMELGNAGAGLRALGITERVRDGSLRVEGTPIPQGQPGDMQGKLVLEDFSVHKAPMLAKLINVLSIPGLLNILNQDTGLKFQRAEAELVWLNRDGGALLQFKDGRTSGASLGLTFEGEVNTAANQMAIQGTVVPMSEVNSLLASIPLVGDILTGGKTGSGIFAATYKMNGPTSDPDVSVNPLSVLTPGILRRILFESGTPSSTKAAPLTKEAAPAQ